MQTDIYELTTEPPAPPSYKIGLLTPWDATFEEFSALTSAAAIEIAIEDIHKDPYLNSTMEFK